MTTLNGISVSYVRSNEVYDIFAVYGISQDEKTEQSEPIYIERLRSAGHTEESILTEYA